jgi:hypothetical protein
MRSARRDHSPCAERSKRTERRVVVLTGKTSIRVRSAPFDYIEGFYNATAANDGSTTTAPADYEQHSAA